MISTKCLRHDLIVIMGLSEGLHIPQRRESCWLELGLMSNAVAMGDIAPNSGWVGKAICCNSSLPAAFNKFLYLQSQLTASW